MRRRDAIAGLVALGALSGARVAVAQAAKQSTPYRIAVFPDMTPQAIRNMLGDAIRTMGWSEGRDVILVDSGFQYGAPHLEQAARRVVDSRPDLILTYSSNYALALHRATVTIPIVMWTSGYPVEVGVANSLAQPGKNVTGNTQYAGTGIWGKLLELLRDAKPSIKRIGVCWGYVPPAFPKEEIEPCYRELRQAARALGVTVTIVEFATPDRVPAALAEIDAGRPDALLITTGPAIWVARRQVMEFAIKRHLPTVVDFLWEDDLTPMLMFAAPAADLIRRALYYVDRIRKGARPGDLPIQLPPRFELIVNRKMAKAIDLAIPQLILLRADRVIE